MLGLDELPKFHPDKQHHTVNFVVRPLSDQGNLSVFLSCNVAQSLGFCTTMILDEDATAPSLIPFKTISKANGIFITA